MLLIYVAFSMLLGTRLLLILIFCDLVSYSSQSHFSQHAISSPRYRCLFILILDSLCSSVRNMIAVEGYTSIECSESHRGLPKHRVLQEIKL